jgi:type IV pilus assembly protein PilQ
MAEPSKYAYDDLLKILESADSQPAETAPAQEVVADAVNNAEEAIPVAPAVEQVAEEPASDPLARVLDSMKAADARAEEADSSMMEPVAEEVAATIDDVDMEAFGEDSASTSGQLISVRLNKVGLEEAISLFAQLSGANIIVPELAEASQISVNLKDVEWRSALQSILDSYNYELFQKVSGSNVYSVRRRPPGAPEPQVVETFKLRYATVPNVATLIRELLPVDAKISEFASRNMIVVKSSESSLSEIRSVLASIDIVRQQVFIESKFMELSDGAQQDLGIDWKALQAYSAGTVGSTDRSYSKTDSSKKTSSSFTDANGLAYEDASGYADQGQRVPGSGLFTLEGVTPALSDVTTKGSSEFLTSVLSADEFRLVLSALQENKGVNVVSNPKIIVANEEKANISIVRKEPNLKQERQQALNDTPDTVTFTLNENEPFFKYGVELDVTPSINTSSNITVTIKPSLTRKFGDKQAGDNTYPIIDEKTIETVFSLASGQTAAIGGLTEVEDSETERKVPVLGSIPYLGRLFSWKQTVSDQRETIIFVTVGLANTLEIDAETGLPEDSELARRQIIKDRSKKTIRSQGREFFEAEESDKVEDMLKVMRQKEDERQQDRLEDLQQEAGKGRRATGQGNNEVSSLDQLI